MPNRDVTSDAENPDKLPVGYDKVMGIDTETTPDELKEFYVSSLNLPRYKIGVTVSANDLIVTVTHLDGSTPSSTKPLYFKINDTIRTVTAALTITLADATNWFNAGGAELATKEIDYFLYAIWDSNSSVVAIGPARIPYGRLVSDFSATTTNEKHLGNYANYTTTDDVCVIGRFAATLSAGAGYTWTVPTFTNANLIQEPIFKTRSLTWAATVTSQGGTPTTVTSSCKYIIDMSELFVIYTVTITDKGTATGAIFLTVPFMPTQVVQLSGGEFNNGLLGWAIYATNPRISTLKYDSTTFWVNGHLVIGSGTVLLV